MRFRHLHTTIFQSSRNRAITNAPPPRNPRRLFVPPAAKTLPTISNIITDSDIVKCTVTIRNHLRNREFDAALRLFNSMPRKSTITYGTMISGCFANGKFKLAQQLFDKTPEKNLVIRTIMIRGNIKNKDLGAARRLFDEMPEKNVVSWNTILYGYVHNGYMDEAERVFGEMPVKDVVSWNTILSGYAQNGFLDEAERVFGEMPLKNVVSWTTILAGYAQNGFMDEAKRVFDEMPEKNVISWTTILAGYTQNGFLDEAKRVFDEMPEKDDFSWAAIIAGYSQNGDSEEALRIFVEATRDQRRLSGPAFVSALSSCADITATELGKQIHGCVVKGGVEFGCNVGNALVSMYSRCGSINDAHAVFKGIEYKSVSTWNAMIVGYARHGFGQEALQHFESMKQSSIQPDDVTMVGVLIACSHTGLVDKAKHYFYSMSQDQRIVVDLRHYTCMIDLLGRAGLLDEAQNLMKNMPFEPNAVTWGALLGASRMHGDTELGEKAAEMLFALEPWNSRNYVLLSNIYAASGRWEDAKKMRVKMRDLGVCKRTGYSWVEVLKMVHTFSAGDFTYAESEGIRAFLDKMDLRMREDGYVPAMKSALHDVEEEEKQHTLGYHSERLAVAYGIMKIPSGMPVRVFKNLRVCEDCHVVIKHIAKITGRLIVLRDANRFHHFEGGLCSCGDYW